MGKEGIKTHTGCCRDTWEETCRQGLGGGGCPPGDLLGCDGSWLALRFTLAESLPHCLTLQLYILTCLTEINAEAQFKIKMEPRTLDTLGMGSQPHVAFLVLSKVSLHCPS